MAINIDVIKNIALHEAGEAPAPQQQQSQQAPAPAPMQSQAPGVSGQDQVASSGDLLGAAQAVLNSTAQKEAGVAQLH